MKSIDFVYSTGKGRGTHLFITSEVQFQAAWMDWSREIVVTELTHVGSGGVFCDPRTGRAGSADPAVWTEIRRVPVPQWSADASIYDIWPGVSQQIREIISELSAEHGQ